MRSKDNPHRFGTPAYWRAEFLDGLRHDAGDDVRGAQAILDELARDVLAELTAVERKHKARKGEIEKKRAWAIWLLEACRKMAVPPPHALIDLMRHCAGNPRAYDTLHAESWMKHCGASRATWPARMRCIQLDANSDADISINSLAKEVGVSRRTVRRWRENRYYKEHVTQLRQSRRVTSH